MVTGRLIFISIQVFIIFPFIIPAMIALIRQSINSSSRKESFGSLMVFANPEIKGIAFFAKGKLLIRGPCLLTVVL